MAFCAVVGCSSHGMRDPVSFFRFPSIYKGRYKHIDPLAQERRVKWIAALKREGLTENILRNQRVCSKHFISGKAAALKDKDNPDWVPSLNMGYGMKGNSDGRIQRYKRAKKRKVLNEMSPSLDMVSSDVEMSEPELPANDAAEMGGCCAFGCSNSAEKGFLMKRFPADPIRRALWASKVNRKNWQPTNSTFLCEAHFTSEMFENNRADGRRLLKKTAVPTIFYHSPGTKSSTRKIPLSPNRDEPLMTASSSYNDEEPITNEIPSRLFKNITLEKLNSDPSTCFAEVLSNHGLMQQNEDFKFCLFLFHEMQFLSSNNIKNDVRKSIQQVLLQAFERDGQEI